MKFIIVCGTPVEELRFIGPFDNLLDAKEHAENVLDFTTNWIISIIDEPHEKEPPYSDDCLEENE